MNEPKTVYVILNIHEYDNVTCVELEEHLGAFLNEERAEAECALMNSRGDKIQDKLVRYRVTDIDLHED